MKLSLRVDHFVEYSRTGFGSPYKGIAIIQVRLRYDRECFETVFKKKLASRPMKPFGVCGSSGLKISCVISYNY